MPTSPPELAPVLPPTFIPIQKERARENRSRPSSHTTSSVRLSQDILSGVQSVCPRVCVCVCARVSHEQQRSGGLNWVLLSEALQTWGGVLITWGTNFSWISHCVEDGAELWQWKGIRWARLVFDSVNIGSMIHVCGWLEVCLFQTGGMAFTKLWLTSGVKHRYYWHQPTRIKLWQ